MQVINFPVKIVVAAMAALLAMAGVGNLPAATAAPAATPAPDARLVHAKEAIRSALGEVKYVKDDQRKAEALGSIGAAQAAAGDRTASQQTFTLAIQTAQSPMKGELQDDALQSIARAQAKAGDLNGGLQTAQRIMDGFVKADTLASVAVAQSKAGGMKASAPTFAQAIQTIESIDDESNFIKLKDVALASIAGAQAAASDLNGAFHTAKSIRNDFMEADALRLVGAAQAKAGDATDSHETFAQALRTARNIQGPNGTSLMASIAATQVKAGDATASEKTFAEARQRSEDDFSLGSIAVTQAGAGDVSGALQTAQSIKEDPFRACVLESIAKAQAKAGAAAASQQTFTQARKAAQNPYDPRALDTIAIAQAKTGDMAGAEATVGTLAPGQDRCEGYIKVAQALLNDPDASDDGWFVIQEKIHPDD